MSYNGWSNYETWNVKLWLDNEQGSSEEVREMARRARSVNDLAESLKSMVNEAAPDLGASCFADLLNENGGRDGSLWRLARPGRRCSACGNGRV